MVSPELLRRYPFFAGLSMSQITAISQMADEQTVSEGFVFFHEEDELDSFYLLVDGEVDIFIALPDKKKTHNVADQLTGEMAMQKAVVSSIVAGDIFGWSGLIPPFKATAGAIAMADCKVVVFNGRQLLDTFANDSQFAFLMTQRAAQVIRQRLHDVRLESLAAYLN